MGLSKFISNKPFSSELAVNIWLSYSILTSAKEIVCPEKVLLVLLTGWILVLIPPIVNIFLSWKEKLVISGNLFNSSLVKLWEVTVVISLVNVPFKEVK